MAMKQVGKQIGLGVVAVLLGALVGCGGDDDGGTFTASGIVTVGGVGANLTSAAEDSDAGDECSGGGVLSGVREGTEVVVEDADGTKVSVGKLEQGTLPEGTKDLESIGVRFCDLPFTVDDIPESDGLFTLRVEGEEKTFKQSEADDLELKIIIE